MSCTKRTLTVVALLGLAVVVTAGCGKPRTTKDTRPEAADKGKAGHGHDHLDEGPHGGALAEWGEEEYHAEFTVDHEKKQATVYVLDGSAKKAVPIKAESITLTITNVTPPVQVTLKAAPQAGEPAGTASRFTGTHDQLAKVMEFKGEVSGKVGDKPYAGTFEEKPHQHEKKYNGPQEG